MIELLKPILKSGNTWQLAFFFSILSTRVDSIQAWMYPWLDWSYCDVQNAKETISGTITYESYIRSHYETLGVIGSHVYII